MNQTTTSPGTRTTLTEEEHRCASIMAYFNAMLRGGHAIPPYNHANAIRDFERAAEEILKVGNQYPSQPIPGLYEDHPTDSYWGREVPVALRKRPYLTITQAAVLCFSEIDPQLLSDDEYWTLLGHIWVSNTKDKNNYHRSYTDLYRKLFASQRNGRNNLMTPDEKNVYEAFAHTFPVYRGCGSSNEDGLSWSRRRTTAMNFARDWNQSPWFILEGTCASANVIAFFNRDREEEVVVQGTITPRSKTPYFEIERGGVE